MAFLILILVAQFFPDFPSLVAAGSISASLSTNADNLTALNTITAPSWVSAQDYRGTSNILYSCLLTLVACIYSAIHLNVPKAHQSKASLLLDKAKWVALALSAPELVLYVASSQFLEARSLVMVLNKIQGQRPEHRNEPRFDLKYGFFVIVGGFIVNISDITDDYQKVTSTAKGVRMLAEDENHFLRITNEVIEDKSKADYIQKGLVIVQVTWMTIQCIARKSVWVAFDLTRNTYYGPCHMRFVHVSGLDEAEPADMQRADEFVALMAEYSFYTGTSRLKIYASKAEAHLPIHPDRIPLRWVEVQPLEKITPNENCKPFVAVLREGEALESGIGFRDPAFPRAINLTVKGVRRLETAAMVLKNRGWFEFPAGSKFIGFSQVAGNFDEAVSMSEPTNLILIFFTKKLRVALFSILPIIYGGIHLTAWAFDFPTYVERIIWRVCCIDIMATVFFLSILLMGVGIYTSISESVTKSDDIPDFVSIILQVFSYVALFMYAVSRVFIVVESFISLRHVPIGVYATPAWVQMLPHL